MNVSAVVISHGHAAELERSLPALAPQVDELLVIANVPGSLPARLPASARVLENARALSFAANANLGAARTRHDLVLVANPDAVPAPDAVPVLREFMESHPRAGICGPKMLYSDGSWQANNIDDYLKSQNITKSNGIAHVQTFNASLGGPVKRDRLWFFLTARHASTDEVVANVGEVIVTPKDVKWQDAPPSLPKGAKVAVLEGDPAKEGAFVMRAKMSTIWGDSPMMP